MSRNTMPVIEAYSPMPEILPAAYVNETGNFNIETTPEPSGLGAGGTSVLPGSRGSGGWLVFERNGARCNPRRAICRWYPAPDTVDGPWRCLDSFIGPVSLGTVAHLCQF